MRSLTAQDSAHVQDDVTTWALCWRIQLGGEVLRQTSHDQDLTVALSSDAYDLNGPYVRTSTFQASALRGASDLAVDNMEVDALLDAAGLTEADIASGVLDQARYILFLVNWRNPTNSGIVVKRGVVGNVRAFARQLLNGELRGLKQLLQQTTMETYGPTCRAELGDARCGVNLALYTYAGAVDGVDSRSVITWTNRNVGSPGEEPNALVFGVLTFTSGANEGAAREVKADDGQDITFFEPFPYDIAVDDTFSVRQGCDKTLATCRDVYANVINRRAEDYIPGSNRLLAGPP